MEKIKFFVRRSYGNDRAYLADDKYSAAWKRISGRLTLNPDDLKDLSLFGSEFIKVDAPEIEDKGFGQEG